VANWCEGRSLVFDDVFEHEAWNDSDEIRVVLFVDFERPLPPVWAAVNRALIAVVQRSPLVQEGIRGYEEWTRKHPIPSREVTAFATVADDPG
jgi:beta-hydroxylase